ncbi:MAG: hypothetical protein WD557_01435 [Dehalococcoidia bacterium]
MKRARRLSFQRLLLIVIAMMVVLLALYGIVFALLAWTSGINWSYALSGLEVTVAAALGVGLVVALLDLYVALQQPMPNVQFATKKLHDGSWEVVIWNVGDEPAEQVGVWLRDRRTDDPKLEVAKFNVRWEDWTANGDERYWEPQPDGTWATQELAIRLVSSIPRFRGRFVVVAEYQSKGTFEVTGRIANGDDPLAWDSSMGDQAAPA